MNLFSGLGTALTRWEVWLFGALLLVLFPLSLLAGESLFEPFVEIVKNQAAGGAESLPWVYYLKLMLFLGLSFLGLFQIVVRLKVQLYSQWARQLVSCHKLHGPYNTEEGEMMLGLINWSVCRVLLVAGPPVLALLVASALGWLLMSLLNFFMGLPFLSLSIQLTIGIFLGFLLILGVILVYAKSLAVFWISILGDCAAATEPKLPAKTIQQRCGRILWTSPASLIATGLLWLLYSILGASVVGFAVWLLNGFSVQQFIQFQVPFVTIFFLELGVLLLYAVVSMARFWVYHQALGAYYRGLPPSLLINTPSIN